MHLSKSTYHRLTPRTDCFSRKIASNDGRRGYPQKSLLPKIFKIIGSALFIFGGALTGSGLHAGEGERLSVPLEGYYADTIRKLLASDEPAQAGAKKAMANLLDHLENSQFTPMAEALRNSDLTQHDLDLLYAHAGRVVSLEDFLKTPPPAGTYILGIDELHYKALIEVFGFTDFYRAYESFGIDYRKDLNHREKFMTRITDGRQPVVMLVPNHVLTHVEPGKGFQAWTREEFKWLLSHPERLGSVSFVFGNYDRFSPEMIEMASATPTHPLDLAQMLLKSYWRAYQKRECGAWLRPSPKNQDLWLRVL